MTEEERESKARLTQRKVLDKKVDKIVNRRTMKVTHELRVENKRTQNRSIALVMNELKQKASHKTEPEDQKQMTYTPQKSQQLSAIKKSIKKK